MIVTADSSTKYPITKNTKPPRTSKKKKKQMMAIVSKGIIEF